MAKYFRLKELCMLKRIGMIFLFSLTVVGLVHAQPKLTIEGAWVITETSATGQYAFNQKATQPSLYIFTKKHYSIMKINGTEPRPEISYANNANLDEIRKVYVEGYIANSGTYEIKDGRITFRPTIAKNPTSMKKDSFSISAIKVEGDILILTTESGDKGPAPMAVTTKLKRVE